MTKLAASFTPHYQKHRREVVRDQYGEVWTVLGRPLGGDYTVRSWETRQLGVFSPDPSFRRGYHGSLTIETPGF